MAAVFLDGGFDAAFALIRAHFLPLVQELDGAYEHADFKSQLQEFVQARPGSMPHYAIIRQEGPDHDKTFWVELKVLNVETLGMRQKQEDRRAGCGAQGARPDQAVAGC